MQQPRTILVVDDEPKIADVVRSYLEKAGYRAVTAHTGAEALALFELHAPALVVLDLMLPDVSGEDVCRAIRRKSKTPVLMLTAKADEQSVLNGLGIGADDYVVKPFSPRQLVARVEAILRRASADPEASTVTYGGGLAIDGLKREIRVNGEPVPLTRNEFNILVALAGRPHKAFTRDELIAAALGDGFEGYDRVIDTHVKNIRQKIEPDPKSPRYVRTVFGVGYRFGGDEDEA